MNKRLEKKLKKVHTGYVWANTQNCKACWECISNCPKQVISKTVFLWHKHIFFRNIENCIGCKRCIAICPHNVFSEEIPNALKPILEKNGLYFNK